MQAYSEKIISDHYSTTKMAPDICEPNTQNYFVGVDYFSGYIEIVFVRDISGETTTGRAKLKDKWGCPNDVIIDNGP